MNIRYVTELWTWVVGIFGATYSFITGHTDKAFQILLLVMIVDIVSGLLKGAQKKRLRSAIMTLGILKKAGIILAIIFAMLLDNLINPGQVVFTSMMTWLAIGNEGLSIIENLTALGVKIPKGIIDKLAQLSNEAIALQDEKDGK